MVNKAISEGTTAQPIRQNTLPIVDETEYMPLEEMHQRLVTTITNFYILHSVSLYQNKPASR